MSALQLHAMPPEEIERCQQLLLQSATKGLREIRRKFGSRAESASVGRAAAAAELRCFQCSSALYEPVTLESGATCCQACVAKCTRGEDAAPAEIGFGSHVNVLLNTLSKTCYPEAHSAAAERHGANELFKGADYSGAEEGYSRALALLPDDPVVLCNRAAARLKLGSAQAALADGAAALRLLAGRPRDDKELPGGALWTKAVFRCGQALLSLATAEAPTVDTTGEGSAAGGRGEGAVYALAVAAAAMGAGPEAAPPPPQLAEALACLPPRPLSSQPTEAAQLVARLCTSLEAGDDLALMQVVGGSSCGEGGGQAAAQGPGGSGGARAAAVAGLVREAAECAVCCSLLHDPVTTPCGHTLCRPCLARTLDHAFDVAPKCPMCRQNLSRFLFWLNLRAAAKAEQEGALQTHGAALIAVTTEIQAILLNHCPEEAAARRRAAAAEEAEAESSEHSTIPVFICSLAMPGVACPLHVFEPRYRLMMRRCLDSGHREFGMSAHPEAEFGTLLRISKFEQLVDGRAILETVGSRRYRVLQWGQKDGYATAKVEWVEDTEHCGTALPAAAALRGAVEQVVQGLSANQPSVMQQIQHQIGEVPAGVDALSFWSLGFAQLVSPWVSPAHLYDVCFGDATRHSQVKRAEAALAIFARVFRAPSESGGGGDADASTDGHTEDDNGRTEEMSGDDDNEGNIHFPPEDADDLEDEDGIRGDDEDADEDEDADQDVGEPEEGEGGEHPRAASSQD